jgi:hypothetical protein
MEPAFLHKKTAPEAPANGCFAFSSGGKAKPT